MWKGTLEGEEHWLAIGGQTQSVSVTPMSVRASQAAPGRKEEGLMGSVFSQPSATNTCTFLLLKQATSNNRQALTQINMYMVGRPAK